MTTTDKVKQCKTPQEALLVLAAAIDLLRIAAPAADPWSAPINWGGGEPSVSRIREDLAEVIDPDAGRSYMEGDDLIVPPASPERQAARADLVERSRLAELIGPSLTEQQVRDAYVKGGLCWLYYIHDRDVVMQIPRALRTEMVADVAIDSPAEADEIGRDILKIVDSQSEGAQLEGQRKARDAATA